MSDITLPVDIFLAELERARWEGLLINPAVLLNDSQREYNRIKKQESRARQIEEGLDE